MSASMRWWLRGVGGCLEQEEDKEDKEGREGREGKERGEKGGRGEENRALG